MSIPKPRAIVVYPHPEGFEVVAADLLEPGSTVAVTDSSEAANDICTKLAWYYRARALHHHEVA